MKKMQMLLNQWIEQSDEELFQVGQNNPVLKQFQILCNGLRNRNELFMALYLSVSRFAEEHSFSVMLMRNNNFKDLQPEWYELFSPLEIYQTLLLKKDSAQRQKFNLMALKVAVQNEYYFMVDEILDGRAYVTPQMLEFLLQEEQHHRLINMIVIPRNLAERCSVPKFLDNKDAVYRQQLKKIFASSRKQNIVGEPEQVRDLHFNDIVGVAFSIDSKTNVLIKLIGLMRREAKSNEIDYKQLFRIFVRLRKIKLLRYLFNLKTEFQFDVSLFIIALEEDAFDVAMLLHREFKYLLRNIPMEDDRTIIQLIIQSLIKVNDGAGMINEKSYLIREFLERFNLRNARILLDNIDRLSGYVNK